MDDCPDILVHAALPQFKNRQVDKLGQAQWLWS